MVGQAASVATEATRLANEAGEAIKSSRELIRAALRGLGVASDISEASGPTRAQRPPPDKACAGGLGCGLDDGAPTDCLGMAARLHAGHHRMAPPGLRAKTQDKGGGQRVVNPHARHDECPSKR
jgi:hypothetical protein